MKDWYKPKVFTHLTPKLTFDDKGRVKQYISNAENIARHNFFPLVHRTIVTKRLKKGKDKNGNDIKKHFSYKGEKRESTAKYREIYYPTHLDAHIYSYYAQNILGPFI